MGFKRNAVLVCAAAAANLFASWASAQETLRIGIPFQKDSHFGVAIDTFAEEVAKRTGDRYRVETFYNGSLGAERESVEAVQLGTVDLTFTSTGPVPNFVPEVAVLDVPFLFKDYDNARAVLDGPIGEGLLGQFDNHGIHALAWADNGFRNMTNNKLAISTPEDLAGLKMRTMENPIHIEAYKEFGVIPTPMALTEVFAALQQGVVDGQENPLSVIVANHFDEVQKYVSMTGHVFSPAVFLINAGKWEALSDEDKAAFKEAAKVAAAANRARVDADEKIGIEYLKGKGVEVVENVDKQKFIDALAPVYADFSERFGATLQEIQAAQK
jgi:tripartite ATP-independent transporter DctP family solute receptor